MARLQLERGMSRQSFSLRPLRLTHRTTDDVTECRDVHRGLIGVEETPSHDKQLHTLEEDDAADSPINTPGQEYKSLECSHFIVICISLVVLPELNEPTCFELESEASVAAWEEIRRRILHVITESCVIRIGQQCCNCKQHAILRCLLCGPAAFFCEDCFSFLHRSLNILHVAEKWEVSKFHLFIIITLTVGRSLCSLYI